VQDAIHEAIRRLAAAGIENPRMEAHLLLAHVLNTTRAAVIAGIFNEPTLEQYSYFLHLVAERERRVPLAYLRGTQDFYGLTLRVSPAVLVPRPETELLVEFALSVLPSNGIPLLADVGTGSGCIPIAVLANHVTARAMAFDLSADALLIARENVVLNNVAERMRLVRSDLLTSAASGSFDVIVSNPPYIPTKEIATLQPEVRDYEPTLALDGGTDGLMVFRRLIAQATIALKPNAWLALEAAQGQTEMVGELLRLAGFINVETRKDLAQIERIAVGRKTSE
jgi:release factor glutamine methyltransferase